MISEAQERWNGEDDLEGALFAYVFRSGRRAMESIYTNALDDTISLTNKQKLDIAYRLLKSHFSGPLTNPKDPKFTEYAYRSGARDFVAALESKFKNEERARK